MYLLVDFLSSTYVYKKVASKVRISLIAPSKFSRIKVATMRMISAMLGKTKDIAKTKNMLDT